MLRKENDLPRDKKAGPVLRGPPLCLYEMFGFRQYTLPVRARDALQNFVHGFLNARIRLVKLTGRLGRELAKHVTISQCM